MILNPFHKALVVAGRFDQESFALAGLKHCWGDDFLMVEKEAQNVTTLMARGKGHLPMLDAYHSFQLTIKILVDDREYIARGPLTTSEMPGLGPLRLFLPSNLDELPLAAWSTICRDWLDEAKRITSTAVQCSNLIRRVLPQLGQRAKPDQVIGACCSTWAARSNIQVSPSMCRKVAAAIHFSDRRQISSTLNRIMVAQGIASKEGWQPWRLS